ncbi:micronuclear linker histone polyprotein [Parasteatoda tepidariorum]|uniref:micronuclear linker histone polyprotein n=1 Tax=Parasteatoda tepidariorum TaxID=114398 RepID=UPI001C71A4CB|nr:zinc finger CCCH domain-containing protein 18 isoform X1 [Parasteatoda tepidariorum]XP_015928241.2 zinc finger CCCH domain-containing protein 18 isoform X1 [Parasteatoda tepidariorum]
MSELDFEVAELPIPGPEIIDLTIESSEENEVAKIGSDLDQSNKTVSDLEEGEIKESNKSLCRYFQRGRCWLGENCSFSHVGNNSYKMFDTQTQPAIVYQPMEPGQPIEDLPDAWDKGLREAKKLLLNAKLKKETDLDFEEKQLYQGLDEIIRDNEDFYRRKMDFADRHRKQKETCIDCLRLKDSERGRKTVKTASKDLPSSQKPKNVKSRTKYRSDSCSPVPSCRRHSSSSSSLCGRCEASCHELKNDVGKPKSKLERVFLRTVDAPEAPRKETTQRRCHSSYPRRRSSLRHSFSRHFLYRSHSKSPSKNYSKKYPKKTVQQKQTREQSTSPMSDRRKKYGSSHSKKERSSTISKFLSQINDLASCSSDMTVSSIRCTSVSTSLLSNEEKESTRRSILPVVVSGKKSKGVEHTTYDIDKWLDSVPKTTKESKRESEISTKCLEKPDREKEKSFKTVKNGKTLLKSDRKLSSDSSITDEELSAGELELLRYIPNKNHKKLKQDKKKAENNVKLAPKTSVKNLSTNNNRGTNEENHSSKTNAEYPPPKIIYDYGSDTDSLISKLIHDYGSDRLSSSQKSVESNKDSPNAISSSQKSVESNKDSPNPISSSQKSVESNRDSPIPISSPQKSVESNRDSPVPKTSVEHSSPKNDLCLETLEENNFSKESNNVEQVNNTFSKKLDDAAEENCSSTTKVVDTEKKIPELFDRNKMEQNNNSPSNVSGKRLSSESSTELSDDELELLKYVSNVSTKIRKRTKKNPSQLSAKKTKQKSKSKRDVSESPKRKSAVQEKEETTEISRRERLMQQLEAVELAIANKKRQAKLEAKLRKKKKK